MEEVEYCDPFDGKKYGYYMKLEHAGRYVFARDFIEENKVKTVADISCATGYGTALLSAFSEKIIGIDNNEQYLKKAKKRKIKNAEFILHNFNDGVLSSDNKVDLVVSFETIEHIENTANFVESLKYMISKNGHLILSVPNPEYEEVDELGNIVYPFHKHIFSKEEVIELFTKNGFELKDVYGQSLCNMIVSSQHELKHNKSEKYNKKYLNKYNYSPKSVEMNSYIFAYPNKVLTDLSYSYIYIFKRK